MAAFLGICLGPWEDTAHLNLILNLLVEKHNQFLLFVNYTIFKKIRCFASVCRWFANRFLLSLQLIVLYFLARIVLF